MSLLRFSSPLRFALCVGACLGLSPAAGAFYLPIGFGRVADPKPLSAPDCTQPTDPLELALWRVVTSQGRADLSCNNSFVEYQRTPRSAQNPQNAFDKIAEQIRGAKTEVLLTTMEWHAGVGHPGYSFAQAVADLYAKVRANPSAYPQGMHIRLALGGFPELSGPDGGAYALAVVRDLRSLGVPLSDTALNWQVAVMNYPYVPHSHVKLHVIDGEDLTVAGFNYTDWHLTRAEAGGHDLHDLGLRMRGPIAQQGVAVFDDIWRHSKQIGCPAEVAPAEVKSQCWIGDADPVSHPDAVRHAVSSGTARAFLLYRRAGDRLADRAIENLFTAAQSQIDLMEADFSSSVPCWLAYVNPTGCESDTFPVYMTALLDAMERGVHVRLLTVNYGYGAYANRAGIALMRDEAKKRGLEKFFDARYVKFDMHTKAFTVDHRVVVAGSSNMHFSSWSLYGLSEANLATSDPAAVQEQEDSFEEVWNKESVAVPLESWQK